MPRAWPTSIVLSDALKADLKRIANVQRRPLATLIRLALEDYRERELPLALEKRKRSSRPSGRGEEKL